MINYRIILSFLGSTMILLSTVMFIPLMYAFITVSRGSAEFLASMTITMLSGLLIKNLTKNHSTNMTIKDMFLFTSLLWITIVIFAAIPIHLIMRTDLLSSCIETAAAVSTSGNTVIGNVDLIPGSILIWRSILQYLGGIGFIAVGIAILPNLNVGGMKLFSTESSKESTDKVMPKSKTLASGMLLTYLGLTALAYIVYYLLGMSSFDAFNHALTSLSTGGMSTHQSSMNYFPDTIHWAVIIFMFLGALPFPLVFLAVHGHIKELLKDDQVKGFIAIIIVVSLVTAASLVFSEDYSIADAVRISLFNTVSVISTTGYSLEDYSNYNDFITMLFFFLIPIGACSSSTSGGLKIFRLQIGFILFKRQIKQLMHPAAIFPQKYNSQPVNDVIIRSIITLFCAYFIVVFFSSLLLCLSGFGMLDALSATMACMSNLGIGLGPNVGPNGDFSILTNWQKIILCFDMITGRLEVLTILICFHPGFWKV